MATLTAAVGRRLGRRRSTRGALLSVLLAGLLCGSGCLWGSQPASSSAPVARIHLLPGTSSASPQPLVSHASKRVPPLFVQSTLDLANGTVVPGNYYTSSTPSPSYLSYDPANGRIYGAGAGHSNLVVLNASTDQMTSRIPVIGTSFGLTYDAGTSQIFDSTTYCSWRYLGYCLATSGRVLVVNGSTDRVVASVPLGTPLGGLTYDPTQSEVWVAVNGTNRLVAISDATDQADVNLSVGLAPSAVAFDNGTGSVFVTNGRSDNVTVISAASPRTKANVTVGSDPVAVECDPPDHEVFVANAGSDNLTVIDDLTDRPIASISLSGHPKALTLDAAKGELFVALSSASHWGNLTIVSPLSDAVIGNVTTNDSMGGMTYDPAIGEVFATDLYSGTVLAISDQSDLTVGQVYFSMDPTFVASDPDAGEIFVTDSSYGIVTVVSDRTQQIVKRINIGDASGAALYDPGRHEILVANQFWGNISIISDRTNSIVGSIEISNYSSPYAMAYDPAQGEVFVGDFGSNNVSVVNDTTNDVVATVPVGSEPISLAYDPAQSEVFVANSDSNYLSVISTATNRVVRNIHLGDGSDPLEVAYDSRKNEVWAFYGGENSEHQYLAAISSTTDRITARVVLPFVTNPGDITFDPARGQVILTDAAEDWNGLIVVSDSTDRVSQYLATGGSTIGGVGPGPVGVSFDAATGAVYVAVAGNSTLAVVAPAVVTFSARGLGSSVPWSVTDVAAGYVSTNTTTSTGSGTISFWAPNGTFRFKVSANGIDVGVLRISGAGLINQSAAEVSGPVTLVVRFSSLTVLCFSPADPTPLWPGLPTGTSWTVSILPVRPGGPPGQTVTALAGQPVNFSVPTGSHFRFVISSPAGYRASPAHGTVVAHWTGTVREVRFRAQTSSMVMGRSLPTPPVVSLLLARRPPAARGDSAPT